MESTKLFSAISLADSEIGKAWEQVYTRSKEKLSKFELMHPNDLHITIIYIGSWSVTDLLTYEAKALIPPPYEFESTLKLHYFGKHKNILALELDSIPEEWSQSISSSSNANHPFRPHITLTRPRNGFDITSSDLEELKNDVQKMLPAPLQLRMGPTTSIEFFVSGITHNSGQRYLTLNQYLQMHRR